MEEEDWVEEEMEQAEYCDYDVAEFCEDPHIKGMCLCTTECAAYLRAVEEDAKETAHEMQ